MNATTPILPIDLRSDTVTQPSPQMRQAMHSAIVGDDVYDEDPTVITLQKRVSQLTGKESALFVTSGTMGNLISLLVQCQRGDQAIVGTKSHISLYEQSGASALGGIRLKTVDNSRNGQLDLTDIESAITSDDIHFSRTKLISLENTWNGTPIDLTYIKSVSQIAKKHHLKMHLDGARIFNAALALNIPVNQLVDSFDTVQFCFSKGLAAPIGSIICGSNQFIYEAKRMRKVLGGGMRQVGVLASACLVSLDTMIKRLITDHQNADLLANGLTQIEHITVEPCINRTNMVFFNIDHPHISTTEFILKLAQNNVLMLAEKQFGIRAVTHYGIEASDIDFVLKQVKIVINKLEQKK